MTRRKCKKPKFDVIVCCQGQPFHYYCSTLIGALIEYGYQYLTNKKYKTMNFSLKQVFFIKEQVACNCTDEEIAKSFIEDVEAVKDLLPQESENNNERL